jgi:hypothetical protein
MLQSSLILISATAFCLTILSVLLSESEQRRIVDWSVRAWVAIDQFRACVGTKYLFKIVLEDSPPTTVLATTKCFVGGVLAMSIFGTFLVLSVCALLGALLVNDNATSLDTRTAVLIWLYGCIALTTLLGLLDGVLMVLLSVTAVMAACILVVLSIVELLARRLAEHQKGPIIALGLLVAAALSLLKAFA